MQIDISHIDKSRIPSHVAIIMDGNGRWAQSHGMERSAGHVEGVNTVRRITEIASEIGVKYLTLYTFSTENWNRKKEEVEFLMRFGEKRGFYTIAEGFDRLVIMNGKEIQGQKEFVDTADEFFEKYSDMPVTKISYMNTVSEDDVKMLKNGGRIVYAHSTKLSCPELGDYPP